nr:DUF5615 family PIN-like protein [Nitrosomonas nitrosa]
MSSPKLTFLKFYSNECFPLTTVKRLQSLGYDVVTTADRGKNNKGVLDEHVLEYAIRNKRALLTQNRKDFIELHEELDREHHGIVVCMDDKDHLGLADLIIEKIKGKISLERELIRVTRPSQ